MSNQLDDFLKEYKSKEIGKAEIGKSSDGLNTHKVKFPDGTIQYREFVKKKPTAILLAKTRDGQTICIGKTAANCSEGALLKLPSVELEEENEEAIKVALRKILKEVGFETGEIIPIGFHYQDPGLSGERVYEYCAIDCYQVSEPGLAKEKNEKTIFLSQEDIKKAIIKNKLLDASSLIVLMRTLLLNEKIQNAEEKENYKLDELLEKCKCTQLGETLSGGSFYKIMERMVQLPDGTKQKTVFVKKKPAAIVLAITTKGEIISIVQPIANCPEGSLLEFPAGYLEETEEATKAALRELLEETGFETKKVISLGYHYQDSELNGERVYEYCAIDCSQVSEQVLDRGEYIKTILLSQEEIKNAIISGKLLDANSLIAFMKVLLLNERIKILENRKGEPDGVLPHQKGER